jgi:hypothetical protein
VKVLNLIFSCFNVFRFSGVFILFFVLFFWSFLVRGDAKNMIQLSASEQFFASLYDAFVYRISRSMWGESIFVSFILPIIICALVCTLVIEIVSILGALITKWINS